VSSLAKEQEASTSQNRRKGFPCVVVGTEEDHEKELPIQLKLRATRSEASGGPNPEEEDFQPQKKQKKNPPKKKKNTPRKEKGKNKKKKKTQKTHTPKKLTFAHHKKKGEKGGHLKRCLSFNTWGSRSWCGAKRAGELIPE